MSTATLRLNFGKRLRQLRMRRKFTQEELGQRSGLVGAHIAHFETGRRLPSFENLFKLLDTLGVSLLEFESL